MGVPGQLQGGDPVRTHVQTEKGLMGRAQAKGKGGHDLEVVTEFGQARVMMGGWTPEAIGAGI